MSLDYKDCRLKQGPMPIDADRVSQVLDNLMTNAIRFTPKDGHIGWNARIYDEKVEMTIEDTGQGFPPEESDNLFRKFYQVDKSRSGGGYSGLGLYIARVLVEKHGGAIRAENNSRGGATFKFYVRTINQN